MTQEIVGVTAEQLDTDSGKMALRVAIAAVVGGRPSDVAITGIRSVAAGRRLADGSEDGVEVDYSITLTITELSMDEDGWERAAKKQFSMRKEIIKDAANMRKMEGYRSMLVLALEVATAIGALVSFKNWVESDIYMRDVIDLRQIVPKIPDKSNLLPVRERPTRPSAELVKKDISKLTTEELKAQLALLREQKS